MPPKTPKKATVGYCLNQEAGIGQVGQLTSTEPGLEDREDLFNSEGESHTLANVGASIIRIGFWGFLVKYK